MTKALSLVAVAVLVPWSGFLLGAETPPPRWDNSRLLGAGDPVLPVLGEPVFAHLDRGTPVHLIPFRLGEADHYLLLGRHGRLASFKASDPTEIRVLLELREAFGTPNEKPLHQLYGAAFAPGFPETPHLFLAWNDRVKGDERDRITRVTVTGLDPLTIDPDSRLDLLSWWTKGHDGCDLHFGPGDGFLYASSGDGQVPGDPTNTGQDTDNLRGAILRIDVAGATEEKPYRIPADNPFVGVEGTRPELWSYGLRNPWRFVFHPESHELWIGDNGDTSWEMIHRTARGANHGWSAFEGSHPFRPGNLLKGPTPVHTPPVVEHSHDVMRSVIGGLFYRGEALPALRDHYLYGCYFTQRVWAVSYREGEVGEPFPIAHLGHPLVAFAETPDREVLVTCLDGEILRLGPDPAAETEPLPLPATLGETGLFTKVASRKPAPGVHPYQINANGWSDGATKERAYALPANAPAAVLQRTGEYRSYRPPFGSAFLQTTRNGERPIETQILFYDGIWRGFTYRWREDGSEADLVPAEGVTAEIDGRPWRFPSRNECLACHTQRDGFLLAFSPEQLHRDSQLQSLEGRGHLPKGRLPKGDPSTWPRTTDPYNVELNLEARARSYLDLNCAHCHRETGLGGRAAFQLVGTLPLEETGLLHARPMVGLTGDPESRVVLPGHPEKSELLHRMRLPGPGRMPLLGSQVVDEDGVRLIEEWIRGMSDTGEKK